MNAGWIAAESWFEGLRAWAETNRGWVERVGLILLVGSTVLVSVFSVAAGFVAWRTGKSFKEVIGRWSRKLDKAGKETEEGIWEAVIGLVRWASQMALFAALMLVAVAVLKWAWREVFGSN